MSEFKVRVEFVAYVEAPDAKTADYAIEKLIDKLSAVDTSPVRWDDVEWSTEELPEELCTQCNYSACVCDNVYDNIQEQQLNN